MTTAPHTARLERRYRRLLSCYPIAHRAMYDEEMITVLMSTSRPDQSRPGAVEALDLVMSGLRARLGMTSQAAGSPAWREAAGVFGYLAAVTVAVTSMFHVQSSMDENAFVVPGRTTIALTVGWALVALATGLGLRRIAAAGAAATVLGQAVAAARTYADDPVTVVRSWWQLVLAIAAAMALVVVARPPLPTEHADRPARALGIRPTITVAAAAILYCVLSLVETPTDVAVSSSTDPTGLIYRTPHSPFAISKLAGLPLAAIASLVLLATLVTVVLRLRPSVRRRVLLLVAPTVATVLLVAEAFGGFLVSSPRFWPPVHLIAPQWMMLALTPLLAFAVGNWLLVRYERKLTSGALLD